LLISFFKDGIIPFIINIDKEQYYQEKNVASLIFSNMNNDIAKCISISVSELISDLYEFKNEYTLTLSYFKYVFICGNKTIFDKDKVEILDNNNGIYDIAFQKHFKTLLKLCKFDELKMEI
jgi:hypothetical protein